MASVTPSRQAPDAQPETGTTEAGEEVISNGLQGEAKISICVPTWKDNADALFASLIRLPGAERCTLLIYDDGSYDSDLTRQLTRQIRRYPGPARLISVRVNKGRSHARNRLMALAETEWILYLDADMQPDDDDFLNRYLDAIDATDEPALVAGGFSLRHAAPTDETRLHAAQSAASECVPANLRAEAPGRYVFSSNLLVHRTVLDQVAFDDGFQGWGWEDVDWGLRVADQFTVHHIDNPASHLGLDTDQALIAKYAVSGANFARLIERHPDAMAESRLYRLTHLVRKMPGRAWIGRRACQIAQMKRAPMRVRLLALKLFRAAVYGGEL
ncbi:MAG: glycosyltransferase [Pseudomonadota bacterium]